MQRKFTIEVGFIPAVQAEIDKLNKKADKLGAGSARVEIGSPYAVEQKTRTGKKVTVRYVDVTLESEPVKIPGWTLAARIDFEDGFPMIRSTPWHEGDLPVEFRETNASRCDHCNAHRRRNDVFVFRNEGGEYIQVGRSCLRDFMGTDPARVVAIFEFMKSWETLYSDDEDGFSTYGSGAKAHAATRDVLAVTSAVIRRFGWVSMAQARERDETTPTAWAVQDALFPNSQEQTAFSREVRASMTDADWSDADETLAWIQSFDDPSDYQYNLQGIAEFGAVDFKRVSFFCSALPSYRRAVERAIERAREEAARPESGHVGAVGGRFEATVKVTGRHWIETTYGSSCIVSMIDESGNALKWFASNPPSDFKVGDTVRIKGTVKKHGEYRGRKETNLTRCKIAA